MKFYRLEDKDRRGVYCTEKFDSLFEAHGFSLYNSERHPTPWQDSKMSESLQARMIRTCWGGRIRYGFFSMEQFRSWFYDNSLLEALGRRGVKMSVYDVPDIIEGNAQAAIIADHHTDSNLVEQISLKDITKNNSK